MKVCHICGNGYYDIITHICVFHYDLLSGEDNDDVIINAIEGR